MSDLQERADTLAGSPDNPPYLLGEVIALANAALPDDDARKFTWAMVDAIRDSVETAQEGTGWQVDPQDVLALAAADAIAALLPPR